MKKIIAVVLASLMLFGVAGCSSSDKFTYNDLEITIKSDMIEWSTLTNKYSDRDGAVIFKVPITIRNVGTTKNDLSSLDSLFMHYKQYNPKNEEEKDTLLFVMDTISTDYNNYFSQKLQGLNPGAEFIHYMSFYYYEDGKYTIEFRDGKDEEVKRIRFNVERP